MSGKHTPGLPVLISGLPPIYKSYRVVRIARQSGGGVTCHSYQLRRGRGAVCTLAVQAVAAVRTAIAKAKGFTP